MSRLGHHRYGAHGNDAGALFPDRAVGVHITGGLGMPTGDPAELADLPEEDRASVAWVSDVLSGAGSSGYAPGLTARPQTLGFGWSDSPVAQLAYLVERFKEFDRLATAAELHEPLPQCRVLTLTGLGKPGNLRRGAEARIWGFMLKDSRPQDLVAAIRKIAAGEHVVDQQLALVALAAPGTPLTEREAAVLRLSGGGATPRQIALDLHSSYGTVRNYLASAVTKLNGRTRMDAIRIATEVGWI
ncbi:DNA-binding response regulator [Nonomuraea sp. NPDC050790]|uniref:DNA-binding response regulator n=1 Tax=Nonomuraea sp. NPDC050790 TaxID=3364371 RepID=UPI00378D0D93